MPRRYKDRDDRRDAEHSEKRRSKAKKKEIPPAIPREETDEERRELLRRLRRKKKKTEGPAMCLADRIKVQRKIEEQNREIQEQNANYNMSLGSLAVSELDAVDSRSRLEEVQESQGQGSHDILLTTVAEEDNAVLVRESNANTTMTPVETPEEHKATGVGPMEPGYYDVTTGCTTQMIDGTVHHVSNRRIRSSSTMRERCVDLRKTKSSYGVAMLAPKEQTTRVRVNEQMTFAGQGNNYQYRSYEEMYVLHPHQRPKTAVIPTRNNVIVRRIQSSKPNLASRALVDLDSVSRTSKSGASVVMVVTSTDKSTVEVESVNKQVVINMASYTDAPQSTSCDSISFVEETAQSDFHEEAEGINTLVVISENKDISNENTSIVASEEDRNQIIVTDNLENVNKESIVTKNEETVTKEVILVAKDDTIVTKEEEVVTKEVTLVAKEDAMVTGVIAAVVMTVESVTEKEDEKIIVEQKEESQIIETNIETKEIENGVVQIEEDTNLVLAVDACTEENTSIEIEDNTKHVEIKADDTSVSIERSSTVVIENQRYSTVILENKTLEVATEENEIVTSSSLVSEVNIAINSGVEQEVVIQTVEKDNEGVGDIPVNVETKTEASKEIVIEAVETSLETVEVNSEDTLSSDVIDTAFEAAAVVMDAAVETAVAAAASDNEETNTQKETTDQTQNEEFEMKSMSNSDVSLSIALSAETESNVDASPTPEATPPADGTTEEVPPREGDGIEAVPPDLPSAEDSAQDTGHDTPDEEALTEAIVDTEVAEAIVDTEVTEPIVNTEVTEAIVDTEVAELIVDTEKASPVSPKPSPPRKRPATSKPSTNSQLNVPSKPSRHSSLDTSAMEKMIADMERKVDEDLSSILNPGKPKTIPAWEKEKNKETLKKLLNDEFFAEDDDDLLQGFLQ